MTTEDAVNAALRACNNQRVRTLPIRETNTVHVVQYLFKHGVQDMADGEQSLTRRVVEVTADAIDYPLFHSKRARCTRICRTLCPRDRTVGPTFQKLVNMGVLVARRQLTGNSYEYGLANYFAAILPQPP